MPDEAPPRRKPLKRYWVDYSNGRSGEMLTATDFTQDKWGWIFLGQRGVKHFRNKDSVEGISEMIEVDGQWERL